MVTELHPHVHSMRRCDGKVKGGVLSYAIHKAKCFHEQ